MGTLLIISAISGAGVAFLIYFEAALWREAKRQPVKRVLILKYRETIARNRYQPRVLYMHRLDTIRQHQGERAREL